MSELFPRRVQLRRAKGWRMPADTVKVDRSSEFGNPFRCLVSEGGPARAVALFTAALADSATGSLAVPEAARILESLDRLRGKNLACWCALDAPCHADVLLALANREPAS